MSDKFSECYLMGLAGDFKGFKGLISGLLFPPFESLPKPKELEDMFRDFAVGCEDFGYRTGLQRAQAIIEEEQKLKAKMGKDEAPFIVMTELIQTEINAMFCHDAPAPKSKPMVTTPSIGGGDGSGIDRFRE